ncbi:MAG: hypothetical protein OEU26_24520, partial [Candidatus Tectomicrobia bacterium]|nr:hypothetical protein [Candidatus Tectomicrobia bacterium]
PIHRRYHKEKQEKRRYDQAPKDVFVHGMSVLSGRQADSSRLHSVVFSKQMATYIDAHLLAGSRLLHKWHD